MAKEKKQFRELSDEELKQVNGGGVRPVIVFDLSGGTFDVSIQDVNYGVCIDGVPDENGNCPQK